MPNMDVESLQDLSAEEMTSTEGGNPLILGLLILAYMILSK